VTHVHSRKELENYLLEPAAIYSALRRQLKKEELEALPTVEEIAAFLESACEEFKEQVFNQSFAKKLEGPVVKDNIATRLEQERTNFETNWRAPVWRVAHVPGKDVLKSVKRKIQDIHKISITNNAICDGIKKDAIPSDLLELFKRLQNFLVITR
jgi:hypothetical protein